MNPRSARRPSRVLLAIVAAALMALPAVPVLAAPSGSAGSGVWDVPSAESKRAGHLGLSLFTSYRTLGLRDSLDTHFNDLRGGVSAVFGIPGGFELSGTLPLFADYVTTGSGSSPFGEDLDLRYGDLTGRLRWTTPFLVPGLRWGAEGEVGFPTGSDDEVVLPSRGALKPYTSSKTDVAVRSMLTWDARGSSQGQALRLHAGAGYHFQGDESRYFSDRTALPLDLPMPTEDKDNDFLSLFAAAELDLARVTLFGEISTDQYVNQRGLIAGKENRITVTPGVRFWIPGGMNLNAAYSMNLSEDDAATAFDPNRAFSERQLRVSLSLGTIYRNARAMQEAAAPPATPTSVVTAPPVAAAPSPAPALRDTLPKPAKKAMVAIEDRHETQLDQRPVAPKAAVSAEPVRTDSVERIVTVEKQKVVMPAPVRKPAAADTRFADTDGDGIPDDQDHCPLLAEDMDGFQDLDGCPDLDNDRDGILDVNDVCPNDPETYNGYYDFDGCPDELPGESSRMYAPKHSAPTSTSVTPPAPTAKPAPPAVPAAPRAAAPAVERAETDSLRRAVAAERSADRAVTDSLRRAISAEQARSAEMSARLTQLEVDLKSRPAPAVAPAPVAAVAPATVKMVRDTVVLPAPAAMTPAEVKLSSELEAQRRRSAELETRLRALEAAPTTPSAPAAASLAAPSAPAPVTAPVTAPAPVRVAETTTTPVVVTREPSRMSMDNADRLRSLEAEVASLRAAAAAQPKPAAEAKPSRKAAPDTTGMAILKRLAELQSAMDSLTTARAVAPAAAPAPPPPAVVPDPEADARTTLDLMLPVGTARVFPEIQFPSASAALESGAQRAIQSIADVLRLVPAARVEVVGHTDNLGRARTNMALSRERARSVADALMMRGVEPAQLTVLGRGDTSPIASNATDEGRRANRRVEFTRTR